MSNKPRDPLATCIKHWQPAGTSTEYLIQINKPTASHVRRSKKSGLTFSTCMGLANIRLARLERWLREQGCVKLFGTTVYQGPVTRQQVLDTLSNLRQVPI